MPISFDWDSPDQRVLRFSITDPWNWKDLHRTMRVASFRFDALDHSADIVLDLRQSRRLPAGALGQIRSLGKAIHAKGHDRLLVIGLDDSVAGPLGGDDGIYSDGTRLIRFVDNDADAQQILAEWVDS